MKRPATFTCERVALTLRSKHGSNENTIEALAIPEISPVTSPPADGEIVTMMTRKEILPAGARPDAMTFREDDANEPRALRRQIQSKFLLAETLHHHFRRSENRFPETVECLRQSFYVENLEVGVDNLQMAQQIYSEAKTILADAGMEIRKWASNTSC
ncbi:hypothetical protein MRX96_049956 [Rhipicephalus microplus]